MADDIRAAFAERLRDERKARGWTQAYLAGRAGVGRTTVSSAEQGCSGIYLDVAVMLARALGVSLGTLTGETEARHA